MTAIDGPDPIALERADQEAWYAVMTMEARYDMAYGTSMTAAYQLAARNVQNCREHGTTSLLNCRIARAAAGAIIELEKDE